MKTLRTKAIKALANLIAEVKIETEQAERVQRDKKMKQVYAALWTRTSTANAEAAEIIAKNTKFNR